MTCDLYSSSRSQMQMLRDRFLFPDANASILSSICVICWSILMLLEIAICVRARWPLYSKYVILERCSGWFRCFETRNISDSLEVRSFWTSDSFLALSFAFSGWAPKPPVAFVMASIASETSIWGVDSRNNVFVPIRLKRSHPEMVWYFRGASSHAKKAIIPMQPIWNSDCNVRDELYVESNCRYDEATCINVLHLTQAVLPCMFNV